MKESTVSTTTLLHGDCLELMKDIPDKSIDAIIADLPYGTTACKWDTIIPFEPLWMQYKRVIKDNGAIVLTASQPFTSALVMSNPKMFKYEWIWEKDRASNFLNAKFSPMKYHENICVFSNGKHNYYPIKTTGHKPVNKSGRRLKVTDVYGYFENEIQGGQTDRYPKSIQKFNVKNSAHGQNHPTEKPVPLLEYLIKTYTNEGDTVLDNTMGSGTTGVACVNLNRNFIGMELDETYFNIATNRIQEAKNNGNKI